MDGLKKENFDLRLSLYFYEQRLNDMSSDSIDQALKEVYKQQGKKAPSSLPLPRTQLVVSYVECKPQSNHPKAHTRTEKIQEHYTGTESGSGYIEESAMYKAAWYDRARERGI